MFSHIPTFAAVMHGGRILEVGFGMGISAKFIRDLAKASNVTEHVVVEANEHVFASLQEYARQTKDMLTVTPMLGFWEYVLPNLPDCSFDGILFDPYVIPCYSNILLLRHHLIW
jgi:guanidinoacetate N-methyltransferase